MNKLRKINPQGIEIVLFKKSITEESQIESQIEFTTEPVDLSDIEEQIQTLITRPIFDPEPLNIKFEQINNTFTNLEARAKIADLRTTSIQLPFAVKVNANASWGGLAKAGIFWGDPTHAPLDESYDIWSIKVGRDDEEIDERFYYYGDVTDSSMRFATGWGAEGHRGWTWSTFGPESTAGPVMSLSQRGDLTIKGSVNVNDQILSGGTDIITLMGSSTDHNNLLGLQGGTTDEYYHFSSSQHEELLALIYATPSFTSFTVDGHGTIQIIEVGDEFSSGSIDFTWGTSNSDNVSPNTIDIIDYDHSQIATSEANDGIFTFNYGAPLTHSNSTTRRWRILADNTNGVMFDRNMYVCWYWRYYWGSSASTTLDEAGIEGLQNSGLYDNENRTYSCNTNNYKWICYPTSEGLASHFTDADSGFAIPMEAPVTVSITNSADNPITTDYYAYRTSYSTASALNIIIG